MCPTHTCIKDFIRKICFCRQKYYFKEYISCRRQSHGSHLQIRKKANPLGLTSSSALRVALQVLDFNQLPTIRYKKLRITRLHGNVPLSNKADFFGQSL